MCAVCSAVQSRLQCSAAQSSGVTCGACLKQACRHSTCILHPSSARGCQRRLSQITVVYVVYSNNSDNARQCAVRGCFQHARDIARICSSGSNGCCLKTAVRQPVVTCKHAQPYTRYQIHERTSFWFSSTAANQTQLLDPPLQTYLVHNITWNQPCIALMSAVRVIGLAYG